MTEVTRILSQIASGDPSDSEELLPLVYKELRRLAVERLKAESPGQTLQATALVHEAYLRLVGQAEPPTWESRGHFFAAAAEAMRRILVENARRKRRVKHGGGVQRIDIDLVASLAAEPGNDLVDLDEALDRLAAEAPEKAQVVKLRYFAGLTMPEIARAMSISLATAERYWTYARTWLYVELQDQDEQRRASGESAS